MHNILCRRHDCHVNPLRASWEPIADPGCMPSEELGLSANSPTNQPGSGLQLLESVQLSSDLVGSHLSSVPRQAPLLSCCGGEGVSLVSRATFFHGSSLCTFNRVMVFCEKMSSNIAYHVLWGKEIVIASEKLVRRK